jgi:hypothetical protein
MRTGLELVLLLLLLLLLSAFSSLTVTTLSALKVHKNENFFDSDFEICTFS